MGVYTNLINRWFREVWGLPRNPATVDELLSRDAKLHSVRASSPLSRDEFKQVHQFLIERYPDMTIEVVHSIESGETAAFHAVARGTHQQSGLTFEFSGSGMLRAEGGKIVETWETWDFATMLAQVGVLPAEVVSRELTGL